MPRKAKEEKIEQPLHRTYEVYLQPTSPELVGAVVIVKAFTIDFEGDEIYFKSIWVDDEGDHEEYTSAAFRNWSHVVERKG